MHAGLVDERTQERAVGTAEDGNRGAGQLLQRQRVRQRPGHQRLAQPGDAVQQHVPAAEQAHQHQVNDLGLPDNHAADFVLDPLPAIGQPADRRGVVVHRLAV